jgi:hypothetical protein
VIVSRRPEGLLMVRQVDHQHQCGLMAEAWGNRAFGRPEPFRPLVDAATWHDEGWRSWEAAPEVNGSGRPIDFPDLDRTVHTELYRDCIGYALAMGPRTGLLVSMHGQGLYERRLGLDGPPPARADRPEAVRRFLDDQEALQGRLRHDLGEEEGLRPWAWAGYRLLQAWDLLSLYMLWKPLPAGEEGELPRVPRGVDDEEGVTIRLYADGPASCVCDPFPFAMDEVALPVAARVIPDRAYRSDDDLRRELADADWVTLECTARRA